MCPHGSPTTRPGAPDRMPPPTVGRRGCPPTGRLPSALGNENETGEGEGEPGGWVGALGS